MTFMKWSPEMSVGMEILDTDHKGLIKIINGLAEATGQADSAQILRQSLVSLRRYAETHFAREEAVLTACDYPALDTQREEHQDFIRKVSAINKRCDKDPDAIAAEINEELVTYLKDWLNHHILIEDMAYKTSVQGRAEAVKAAQDFRPSEIWWGG